MANDATIKKVDFLDYYWQSSLKRNLIDKIRWNIDDIQCVDLLKFVIIFFLATVYLECTTRTSPLPMIFHIYRRRTENFECNTGCHTFE